MYTSLQAAAPAIERVWMGDAVVPPGVGHRSDPVLGVDLVFTIDGDDCRPALQGPVTQRTVYPHRPDNSYIGVRFRPGCGALSAAADVAIGELCDSSVPVGLLASIDVARVAEELIDLATLADRGRHLRRVFEATLACSGPPPSVAAALRAFETSTSPVRVGDVAELVGVTERTLQRLFLAHVGVSPKLAARLVRLGRLLDLIARRRQLDLAGLAVSVGYFDQSHMTNDVRRVLGTTPQTLLAERDRSEVRLHAVEVGDPAP